LAFYASTQLLTIITYYSIPYGWVDSAMKTIADILKWHDNMNNPVPSWYLKDFHCQSYKGV
jgi:serine/threonine-protein kinase